jgi:hypothetical protein
VLPLADGTEGGAENGVDLGQGEVGYGGAGRRFSDWPTSSHAVTGPSIRLTFSIQRLQSSDSKILLNLSFLLRLKYKVFFIEFFSYLQHDSLATCTFLVLNILMILNFRF